MNDINEYKIEGLRLLDGEKLHFSESDSGYLLLDFEGESYKQVSLIRLLPFQERERYISVSYKNDDNEWKEIGVIKELSSLPEDELKTCRAHLEYRYYIPVITKIHSISDNQMGYLFIDATTTAGRKIIAVNDWWSNFKLHDNNMLNVVDADGNQYYVPRVEDLDKPSMKKLALFV